jgi:hypothetical protein
MIDNITDSSISVYDECFKNAYGMTIAQAKLRVKDGPPPVNILCSVRKLDAWQVADREVDRRIDRDMIEELAVNLIARFLDVEAGLTLFVSARGSGCRKIYEVIVRLYVDGNSFIQQSL